MTGRMQLGPFGGGVTARREGAIIRPMPKRIRTRARTSSRSKPRKAKPALTARSADPRLLYEAAVQCPEAEIAFVNGWFRKVRQRPARRVREDFCASAKVACEFVRSHRDNTAVGLDLDAPILAWAKEHSVDALPEAARSRVTLLRRNVASPGKGADKGFDAVLAFNFSYWVFKTRATLLAYFKTVRASLAKDGIFFLDIYGGYESFTAQEERRRCKGFTYVWDQVSYDPISAAYLCRIHFEFRDGTKIRNAFEYDWRLWTIPEVRELLAEAGFKESVVHWEGDTAKGEGNGIFRPSTKGEDCASFIAYITAHK